MAQLKHDGIDIYVQGMDDGDVLKGEVMKSFERANTFAIYSDRIYHTLWGDCNLSSHSQTSMSFTKEKERSSSIKGVRELQQRG